jgi:hypothetical protein
MGFKPEATANIGQSEIVSNNRNGFFRFGHGGGIE